MTDKEQTDAFSNDLDTLCKRYTDEFDLTYAQAVGVLQMKCWLLMSEAATRSDET